MPLLDPYEGLYGSNKQGTDLSAFDTLLEGMPTLPGGTRDTAHVCKPNTPSPHAGMGHSMLTPAPPPVSRLSHLHSLTAITSSSPDALCVSTSKRDQQTFTKR